MSVPKHRAKRPVDSCRHFRSGSQPLSCLPCRREPLPGGKHRAPKHRAEATVDRCQWRSEINTRVGASCSSCAEFPRWVGDHRADVTA